MMGPMFYNYRPTSSLTWHGPSTSMSDSFVMRTRSPMNPCVQIDVLVSSKCCQPEGDTSKLKIETYLKRGEKPHAEKIHVVLSPVKYGDKLLMVPGYTRFRASVNLSQHWEIGDEPVNIRYRYYVNGKKEGHPRDVKKRRFYIPRDQQGIFQHYDYPVYKCDELESSNPDVDSLIDDEKVSIAVRDAQLTFLAFLPHLLGRTPNYKRIYLEHVTTEIKDVVNCLCESGKTNKRIPENFDHKKVLLHHLLSEINLPPSHFLHGIDIEHEILLVIRVCKLINDNKLDVPWEEQRKMCLQLVLPDMDKQELVELLKFIETSCPNAGNILQAFIQSMPDNCYEWLQLLPLVHLLRKDSEPFGDINIRDEDYRNLRFWGTHELNRKNACKETEVKDAKDEESFLSVLKTLQPLFKMDPLLIRSCLWLQLTPGGILMMLDNELIDAHIETPLLCSAMIRAIGYQQLPLHTQHAQDILAVLHLLLQRVDSAKSVNLHGFKTLTEDILEKMIDLPSTKFQVVYKALDVFLAALSKERVIEIAKGTSCSYTKESLEDITTQIGVWLQKTLPENICSDNKLTFSTTYEPMLWDSLFAFANIIEVDEEYKEMWNEQMKKHLTARFWNKMSYTNILLLFCHDGNAQKYDALNLVAVRAVEELVKLTDPISEDFKCKLSDVFMKKYQVTLKEVLSWPPFLVFFKVQACGRSTEILSEDCILYLNHIWSLFKSRSEEVITGSVTIEDLNTIVRSDAFTRQFLQLYMFQLDAAKNPPLVEEGLTATIQQSLQSDIEDMEHLMESRKQEVERLEMEKMLNENLRRVCDDLGSVDTADVEEKLTRISSHIKLDEVCTPTILGSKPPHPINTEESCFFKHSKEVQDMLQPLMLTFKSSLFHRAMQKKANDVQHEIRNGEGAIPTLMSITEMATKVWQPVYDGMKAFVDELRDGTIRLVTISDMLRHLRDEPDKLKEEIEKVFNIYGQKGIRDVVQTRCDQIINYFQLKNYNETATKIMKLKTDHGLKGDFWAIQLLLDLNKREDQERTLTGISEETQDLCERLESVANNNQLRYLENLSDEQSKNLLTWIRKEIDDLKELEVFVDLAAGDTDAEFATVLKFHHAATGHAAFIFDLKESCDLSLFLDVLESLSSAYTKDPFLHSNWKDTKENLARLIQIRKNMDSSPLQQAELINERGVYTIGKYEADEQSTLQFSGNEITKLVQFVSDHVSQLFGSRRTQSTREKMRESIIKRREWKKAADVLSSAAGPAREWVIVQKKWRDLCLKAKEYESQKDESESHQSFNENPVYESVLEILRVPEAEVDYEQSHKDIIHQVRTETLPSLILEVDIDGRKKIYTKEDLQDLQSKLSLVVGKAQQESKDGDGKKQMEYFGEVFNAMQQLATTYTNLCSAGNTLFLEWKATFRCDFKRDIQDLDHTVCMDFGVDDKLYGTRSLTEELPDLLDFMDKCLKRWKNHVDEKRNKYYYLNYFTTEQLLRLCHDLACQSRYPDKVHDYTQVFTLLSSVTHESSWKVIQASLKAAMSAATKEILQESQVTDDTDETKKDKQAARRQQEQELATRLAFENLMEDDTLVLAAIHALGTDKEDEEYITWCYNNPAGNKGEKPIHSVTKSWKEIVSELLSKLTTNESSLDVLLPELWDNYLQSVKCVDSEEYLSLDYVGLILKYLAVNASKAATSRIGWAIQVRTDTDTDGLTMVSPEQKFLCSGQVTAWRFQCKASHRFRAIVWRQVTGSDTKFKVVGINDIPAADIGVPVTYQVPEDERISVQPGDVIGWSSGASVLTSNIGGGYLVRWLSGDLHNGLDRSQTHNINSGVQDREYSIEATIGMDENLADSNVFVYLKNRHRLASEFHTYFKENRPNLVICKERDVFTTVLSFYRGSVLPTQEEILVCSTDTTVEEVSLLWRRSIADSSNQRIFCLVHAERLEYNVSVECANLLHELTQKPTGCRLVVVCSLEEEHHSHMVTKLDQFRVELPSQIWSTKGIQQYLQEQFQQRAAIAEILDGDLQHGQGVDSTGTPVSQIASRPMQIQQEVRGDGIEVSSSEMSNRRRSRSSTVSSFLSFAESSILTLPSKHQQETSRENTSKATSPGYDGVSTTESQLVQPNQRSTVQAIISRRAGVGKSTVVEGYVRHLRSKHRVDPDVEMCITIPLHDKQVDNDAVVDMLLPHLNVDDSYFPRVFHFDVAPMVQDGLDDLLFNLLVLGGLVNKHGYAWKCQPTDLFIIEITELPSGDEKRPWLHTLLPNITCYGPQDVLKILQRHRSQSDDSSSVAGLDLYGETLNVDSKLFEPPVQCAYQYLERYSKQQDLCKFSYKEDQPECSYLKVLEMLLLHCGVSNPSWAVLQNFAYFLSAQLSDCERSAFCQQYILDVDRRFTLFKSFVVELMMMMARDFSTPSLDMSDINPLSKPQVSKKMSSSSADSKTSLAFSPSSLPSERSYMPSLEHSPLNEKADISLVMEQVSDIDSSSEDSLEKELECFQPKRRWEKSLHPYLFFNEDHESFTFMGFILDQYGTLIPTGHIRQDPLIGGQVFTTCYGWSLQQLLEALEENQVNFTIDFDDLQRKDKLLALYRVLGITIPLKGLASAEADPDKTYKLTADNVMKMLAIYMRFRCKIPVVIMGETGCGKTRLIQFLCQLLAKKGSAPSQDILERSTAATSAPSISITSATSHAISSVRSPAATSASSPEILSDGASTTSVMNPVILPVAVKTTKVENLVMMKVHGGTTIEDIIKKVEKAEEIALSNQEKKIDTVLFLDEANTTEAVGLIKEIMCDGRIQGRPIETADGCLNIIAACNPYRRHTAEMIAKMKQSGLGYRVAAEKTKERFGSIPLRELVYRVQPIPPSIRPLVWDFGTLTADVEQVYIKQIVEDYNTSNRIRTTLSERRVMASILASAQEFMKNEKNECSFVSLRDVTRCMDVLEWFHNHSDLISTMSEPQERRQSGQSVPEARGLHDVEIAFSDDNCTSELHFPTESPQSFDSSCTLMSSSDTLVESSDNISVSATSDNISESPVMSRLTRALVLALGVCYHARLQKGRGKFREHIAAMFQPPCVLPNGADQFLEVISNCQDEFIKDVDLGPNIAPNAALKENVFLMVICIELRIPLFLVGKPGSSKSLAKSIVSKAMQGAHSKSPLYRSLKQVHMLACQCSPLTTSADILHAFERCAEFQKEKITQNFVSVVVLDEVGLAEDSPKMPLKTLHPLLEPGSTVAGEENRFKRVGFIGLSNWALDPAKMNRGIMVSREDPTEKELVETARGICSTDQDVLMKIQDLIPPLAQGYQTVCEKQSREFFGLRDYYSLIKMIYGFAKLSKTIPTSQEMEHCIKRNFDGFNEEINPYEIFQQCLKDHNVELKPAEDVEDQPDCSQGGLLKASMDGIPKVSDDTRDGLNVSRYLLVLTENFAALPIVEKQFAEKKPEVIFGSSFPSDQEYTQVCRDINSIKICMEAGRTVILLNFNKLYESLYDALNQYYAHYKDKRYVALGLGTHRVKCKVDQQFRLIVIADKTDVYEHFPTPLINRLEKHFLSSSTMLTPTQLNLVAELNHWVQEFSSITLPKDVEQCKFDVEDAFVGFHKDLIAKLVFRFRDQKTKDDQPTENEAMIRRNVQKSLLQCATPEAIMRLSYSPLKDDFDDFFATYFSNQKHSSLKEYLQHHLEKEIRRSQELMLQVTTHSRLLVSHDLEQLERDLNLEQKCLKSLYLHSFQTQQQCRQQVRHFLTTKQDCERILVVQCEDGHRNSQLIACASYCIVDEIMRDKDQSSKIHPKPVHVILVINLARMTKGFVSYHGGPWEMVHIDDVKPPQANRPEIASLMKLRGDIRSVFEHAGEVSAERLLMDSLHRAVSKIDVQSIDESDMRKQISRRISTIRDLLDDNKNGTYNFVSVTKTRIADLLKQRDEETGQKDVGMEWLMKKALEISSIHESGTFRRALWQQLINIVYPILAEVIAFCDYNDNLQLLEDTKENWIRNLWLAIFGDLELAPLHYRDMISPSDSTSPPESPTSADSISPLEASDRDHHHVQRLRETIPVKVFSNSGKPFTASFPFSWLIKKHIDQRYEMAGEKRAIQKRHILEDVVVVVNQRLGVVLDANVLSCEYQHYIDAYLKDFIHMTYTCGPKKDLQNKELECVTCAIKAAMVETRSRLEFDDERSPTKGLVLLHQTYREIADRLKQFSKLFNACPDLLEKHFDQLVNQEDEMILDVRAVEILVSDFLVPTKEECTQPALQKIWQDKMQRVKLLVENVILSVAQDRAGIYGPKSRRIIEVVRPKWHRIRILEIFFMNMYTSPRYDTHQTIFKMGLPVWNAFAGGSEMKSIKTIKRVKNLLENITKHAAKIDFKYGLECTICLSEVTNPVFLECQHVFCNSCISDMLAGGQRKCPTCKKPVAQSFQPEVADKRAFEKFQDFKERRNAFFFEIVSQLCFADNTPPDEKVVEGLLKLVVGRSSDAPQEEGVTFNTDCIDHTPAIRVVILRLLLQSSMERTTQYIDRYLRDIKPATGEDLELASQVCLMFFFCHEDFWFREAALALDPKLTLIEEATKRLTSAKDGLFNQSEVPNVKTLESIAEARFGLIITAQFVHEMSVDEEILKKYKSLNYLFEAAQTVCLDTICKQEAHLFLLKNLCKSFGTDALGLVSKHDQLKWILDESLREWVCKSKDVFVVLGGAYAEVRKGLNQSIQSESLEPLEQIYQSVTCSASMRDTVVLLAIFRQVTLEYGSCADQASLQIKEAMQEFIRTHTENVRHQEMVIRLLENNLYSDRCNELVVKPHDSQDRLRIVALAIHTLVTVICAEDNSLCCPLKILIKDEKLTAKVCSLVAFKDYFKKRSEITITKQETPMIYN
ncbi:E3 ubiquitin-protein ligase rnf213-alpha-like isoform X2 [Amphiura filiformis]|uniref:E3 ubiquitin-protein ligase rnf213-alpha-like isoform X2 n=1 Tax=Amphiura filiformis TaxID=82378 RepID=UPI003B2175F7